MALIELVGIWPSGGTYGPGVPVDPRQAITITQGASFTVRLRLFYPGGAPVPVANLSTTHVLTFKKNPQDASGPLSRAGTPNPVEGINVVDFPGSPLDTKNVEPGSYGYDIASTIGLDREFTVPLSPLKIAPAAGQLGAPVTTVTPVPLSVFGLPVNGLLGQVIQVLAVNPFTVGWGVFAGVTFPAVKGALAAADSDVGLNGQRLTGMADGINPTDGATVGQTGDALAAAVLAVEADIAAVEAQLPGPTPSFDSLTIADQLGLRRFRQVALGGNDVTGDGTVGNPYATLPRALQDARTLTRNERLVVDCSNMGVVSFSAPINVFGLASDRPFYTATSPEFAPWSATEGSVTIQAVPTLAYTLGTVVITTHDLTTNFKVYQDVSQSWAPDALVGMWLVDPLVPGRIATIVTNTVDTITVASALSFTEPPGTLQIFQPSTTFQDTTGNGNFAFRDLDCGVVLRGLKLTSTVNLSTQLIVQRCRNQVLVHMCDVLYLTATSADVRFLNSLLRCKLSTSKMSITDGILNLQNAVVLDWNALSVSVVQQSQILGSQVAFVRCGGFQASVSEFNVTTAWWLGGNGIYRQSAAGGNSTGLGWTLVAFMFEDVVSTGTYPAAINCFGPGVTHVSVCASMGSLPDYGAILGDGAQLKLITSTSLPTGAVSDMKVGANAARTVTHFNTVQPIQNEYDALGGGSRLFLAGSILLGPSLSLPRLHPFTTAARPSGANQPPDGTVIWNTTEKDINVSDGVSWYRNGVVDP